MSARAQIQKSTQKVSARPAARKKPAASSVKSSSAAKKTMFRKQSASRRPANKTGGATKKRPVRRQSQVRRQPLSLMLTPVALNWLAGVALLMVLGGAALWSVVWINNPNNLPIHRVDWQSEFRYLDREELQALIEPFVQTNLYLLDEVALEQELERHPWIRAVSLRKAWPDELFLNVEAQLPIAFWGDKQLLNQFGEIFPAELPEKLGEFPMIYSPKNNGREMAERFVAMSKALRGLGIKIVELTENDNGSWRMKLNDGQDVIIGRKEQEKRIKRFRVGYMQELRQRFSDIRTVDLRYTNGFAIEWKRGSEGAGAISSRSQTLGNRGS